MKEYNQGRLELTKRQREIILNSVQFELTESGYYIETQTVIDMEQIVQLMKESLC